MFAPEGKVFVGLEPGLFSGVPGVAEGRGWRGVAEGAAGQRGPLGQELCEGESQNREEVLSQPRGRALLVQGERRARTVGEAVLVEGKHEGGLISCLIPVGRSFAHIVS